MADTTTNLLPVNGATLSADPRVLEAARTSGARHGMDYTDDKAVTALLAERQRAMGATQRGWLAWIGGLTLTAGVILPFTVTALPERSAKQALLVTGVLLIVGVTSLTALCVRWKRELTHPALNGYRELLGVARAHGIPLTHVPAWLEGRTSGGSGKGWAPIPKYPSAPPLPIATHDAAPSPTQSTPTPPKPAGVAEYEQMADTGGWHDETGCLLLLVALIGAGWAWAEKVPVAYGLLALIPLAIAIWLAGSRQGNKKQALREEAKAYVQALTAAQAAGARMPELSPELKKLLDE
ncbi:putative membrane protein [Streptomyces davaonensis JCM 4913]|uniref:Putative membrane protein n=1 Tax=Streptomyces davaonensis (strain DSM 101723 / JCM 4913 / KCC S-0913 / 768) TaxID=1214101 RepID=K4QVW7_STRDJ|nr:hypothetical protein [Streptomyces davaonensis]CCK28226.1 putative membrane protein [Streptomyces davaonensis JCM 4913]